MSVGFFLVLNPLPAFITPSPATFISPNKFRIAFKPYKRRFVRHVSCSRTTRKPNSDRKCSPLLRVMFHKSVIPVAVCIPVVFCSNPETDNRFLTNIAFEELSGELEIAQLKVCLEDKEKFIAMLKQKAGLE